MGGAGDRPGIDRRDKYLHGSKSEGWLIIQHSQINYTTFIDLSFAACAGRADGKGFGMGTERRSRRAGGRSERLALRAAPPVVNPAPPGQIGGQYRPLTEPDLQDIYDTALRLLAELGMGEVPDRLRDDLVAAGASVDPRGRVPSRSAASACISAPAVRR